MVRYQPRRFVLGSATETAVPSQPIINGSTTINGSGIGEDRFDSNMVIILASLLCALVCALGLNSIVRCALRCSQRMVYETSEEAEARLASKGLKEEALMKIPVVVYKPKEMNIPGLITDCRICLGEFTDGEKVRILPRCDHGFHVKCIDKWLASHSSCPLCRQLLFDQHIVTCDPQSQIVL